MKRGRHILSKTLTFSKWTRKSYAVFVSLNKVIKIARLSVDICMASSLKNLGLCNIVSILLESSKTEEPYKIDELSQEVRLLEISPILACPVNIDIDPIRNYISTNNISPLSAVSW